MSVQRRAKHREEALILLEKKAFDGRCDISRF